MNNNQKMQIFENNEFGKVRTLEENGQVLFCGSDVAKALGYSNPRKAVRDHVRGGTKCSIGVQTGKRADGTPAMQMVEMLFIPEGDVYRLIVHSKLPSAERFERWVFDEVLPTIRKTGGYVNDEEHFINTYLSHADENTKNLFRLQMKVIREQNQLICEKEQTIQQQKPMVDFVNHVGSSKDLITVGQLSKLAHDEHLPIGRNKLFSWLREQGYLRSNNEPYQKYIDDGIFKVKEGARQTSAGSRLYNVTLITGKGQVYLINRLRKTFLECPSSSK